MAIDVDGALATLTLEQKVSLLAGHDAWHTVELPGIPPLRCSDGPAGVRGTSWTGAGSASFPCGTALGATFDPELVAEVGRALGREARSKGANVLLAPTVNLHRTPIGGRNFECMSEDPVLTSRLAVGYVSGVQEHGVACCIKHFVANDTEFERMTISSEVDERTLREQYLLPFEAAVAAGVRSLMSSYNRINGTYASEHGPLLRGVLRDDWGFDGVVFSDWYGTHSAAASLEAGLDLEMPGPPIERGAALLAAVRAGEVAEARVDESVRRLLELFNWSGVGEIDTGEHTDDSPQTRDVIRRAAIAGTVLLRNERAVLPLADGTRVALIGPNSERGCIQGGGSARVRANKPVGPLAALQRRGVDVVHERGCVIRKRLPALRGAFTAEYFDDAGATSEVEIDRVGFMWAGSPAEGIAPGCFGLRVTGTFTPTESGEWLFGLSAVGPAVLRIDGEVVVDLSTPQTGGTFFGWGSPEIRAAVDLLAGVPVRIDVEHPYMASAQTRGLVVGAQPPRHADEIDRAAAAAGAADVAVVVVGTDADWETEGEDRTTMDLPGEQDELIARVAAANRNTVVVINAGSPVTMPWLADVAAVMQVWFPGEEFGEALADVLFGVAEPGGRLPVTIPRSLAETPAFPNYPGKDGQAVYAEGQFIGYRWYEDHDIAPAFVFGHGLGYTTITLGEPVLSGRIHDGVVVRVPVHNTGGRAGSEVVQCYVDGAAGDAAAPRRTLRAFAKVHLAAGESAVAELRLGPRDFSVWDTASSSWQVPPGSRTLSIATSSAPADVVATITVHQ